MGGDHGAAVVLPGAELSLARHPDSEFILVGDRAVMDPLLDKLPRLKAAARLIHTDVAIRMDDKPSQALRHGRWKSSMWLALDAVKKGEADVAVSAGNTGALMAMSRFNLKMLEGIERPAIAALWPTLARASRWCSTSAPRSAPTRPISINLAAMGSAMARVLFDIERPTVGPAQYRRRGGQGPGGGARGRPHSARRPFPAFRLSSASSRATTSARARSTWW